MQGMQRKRTAHVDASVIDLVERACRFVLRATQRAQRCVPATSRTTVADLQTRGVQIECVMFSSGPLIGSAYAYKG